MLGNSALIVRLLLLLIERQDSRLPVGYLVFRVLRGVPYIQISAERLVSVL